MVYYTSDRISNQDKTRWLSWNVDGGMRGFELTRNPGLSNTTEYGAGEFSLPTKPLGGSVTKSTSKALSMIRSQQMEESYPDLSNLKKELERAQRERAKAIWIATKQILSGTEPTLSGTKPILSGTKRFLNRTY